MLLFELSPLLCPERDTEVPQPQLIDMCTKITIPDTPAHFNPWV